MIRRLLLLLLLLAVVGAAWVAWFIAAPYQGFEQDAMVEIPARTSTAGMAAMLHDAGVIRSEWAFLAVRALRRGSVLQAGEYRFDRAASALTVFDRIARGDVFYYELRVPEGSNRFDISQMLRTMGLVRAGDFLDASGDPKLIQDLAPEAPSLEGYLFPATYRITKQTSGAQICREMTGHFRKVWRQLQSQGANVHRAVTMASLVEKETGVAAERPTVASVYHNRLQRGMKLDCDPTVIYAALLENRYRGKIYRSDLDNPHAYNTYRNPGLPPGPIANPGLASLKAALQPAETNYLFFVAKPDGSGGHIFTESLSAHSAAVQDYRRGQR